MGFWDTKRVTVTGGKGFLGSYILEKLEKRGCKYISVANRPEYNLTRLQDINRMYQEQRPDIVIHLAAVVGGIGANRENPGKFFYENAIILTGIKGDIIWDTSKPDGQPRRMLDTSLSEKEFGFKAKTSFREGLT